MLFPKQPKAACLKECWGRWEGVNIFFAFEPPKHCNRSHCNPQVPAHYSSSSSPYTCGAEPCTDAPNNRNLQGNEPHNSGKREIDLGLGAGEWHILKKINKYIGVS